MTFQDLAEEILGILRRGVGEPLPEQVFNDLALRVFRFQCGSNSAYAGFVARRGLDPEQVSRWEDIPFLPTGAFKSTALVSGDPEGVERVFRTSGTTRGWGQKGEHHVVDLALYRESLLPNFRAHLLSKNDEVGGMVVLSLLPSPEAAPDSSLSFMMGEVVRNLGKEGSQFLVGPDGGIDGQGFRRALLAAGRAGEPVLLAGTAFAFVIWMGLAKENAWTTCLPQGSRIMETGGYKGRSKELPRVDFYKGMGEAFGVPELHIVNEYGMTELLSQFYEPVFAETQGAVGQTATTYPIGLNERYHRGPPWVRTRVLDPLTLEDLSPGEVGVLAHLDLVNLGSVAAILTEDLGREVPGGFQVLGRSVGSEPRGCSLAMEDFLASQEADS